MSKKLIALFAAAAMSMPMLASAWAPTGDVTVIVAYKAGSGTDTGARLLSLEAEKYVGKTLIINNLPGADGKIGWTELVKAKPDGQTIGFINLPTFTTIATMPNAPFGTDKIVPIVNHLTETAVVVVRKDSPYKTLQDLVNAAKANPNLKASTNGRKASNHTAAELFAQSAGFKYKAIPYGGTADQLLRLRQGKVDFSCAKVGDVIHLATGPDAQFRILGVFNPKRMAELPDVPTLGELGYYPDWYGSARAIVAPAGTPDDVIAFYVDAFKKTMSDPENIKAHEKAGLSIDFKDNKELAALIKQQEAFCRDTIAKLYEKK